MSIIVYVRNRQQRRKPASRKGVYIMTDKEKYFRLYAENDASEKVIRVFEHYGYIYHMFVSVESLADRVRETAVSSRHAKGGTVDGRNLRLRKMTISEKENAVANGAEIVCTVEFFQQLRKEFSSNKGICAEQAIRKFYGLDDYKLGDKRGFWECGDIELNGKQYSVKFDDASLSAYRTIEKAVSLRG